MNIQWQYLDFVIAFQGGNIKECEAILTKFTVILIDYFPFIIQETYFLSKEQNKNTKNLMHQPISSIGLDSK